MKIRESKLLDVLFLLGLGIAAYVNSFLGVFQFDDFRCIVNNAALRVANFPEALLALWRFSPGRVMTFLTFWVNFQLGALNPFGYHLFNLILHLVNGLLFFVFLLKLKKLCKIEDDSLALLGAAFFLVNPVQTQAVTYIVQRLEMLGFFFLIIHLLSLYWLWQGKGKEKILAGFLAIFSLILGLFCKETVAVAPLLGAIGYLLFAPEEQRPRAKTLFFFGALAFCFFLVLAAIVLKFSGVLSFSPLAFNFQPLERLFEETPSPLQYFATQFKVWVVYLRLTIFPLFLRVEYDYPVYSTFASWDVLLSILFLLGLFLLGIFSLKKNPALLFGLAFFALVLAPSATLIPNGLYEHRLYGALPGIIIALLYGVIPLFQKGKVFIKAALWGFVLLFVVLTFQRNFVWQSEERLWHDAVEKSPKNFRAQTNYGQTLMAREAYEEALPYLVKSVMIRPITVEAHFNLACCLANLGRLEEAAAELRATKKLKCRLPEVRKLVDETLKEIEKNLKPQDK